MVTLSPYHRAGPLPCPAVNQASGEHDLHDSAAARAAFRRALLAWYRTTARDLPWRRTDDPYRVWLSEIMLQQTQVATVVPYYARFLAAFPTVHDLAAAPLDRVLKLWEGLGYYRRARHLHHAARVIVAEHKGQLPRELPTLQKLPGVGRYTAGAIASIAFGAAVPTVDGNIRRVLARLFCIDGDVTAPAAQEELWRLAALLLAPRAAGDFNQALMELGARVCTPTGPSCETCPVARWCAARAAGMQTQLPRRATKRAVPRITAAAAIVEDRGRYLLVQRPAEGLLAGLWGWPQVDLENGHDPPTALRAALHERWGVQAELERMAATVTHIFTHRHLTLAVFVGPCRRPSRSRAKAPPHAWVTATELERYALATVDHKAWRAARADV